MQPQHLRHLFFAQTGRPSTMGIAPAGQTDAHFPQWMQESIQDTPGQYNKNPLRYHSGIIVSAPVGAGFD